MLHETDGVSEAYRLLEKRRNECDEEFQSILQVKTANTEIMHDLQENSVFLKDQVRNALQNIISRMAAEPERADVQSKGCMWLASFSTAGTEERRMVESFGGVQCLSRALHAHP